MQTRLTTPRALILAALACFALSLPSTALAAPPAPGKLDTKVTSPQTFRYKHKAGEINRYNNEVSQQMETRGANVPPGAEMRTTMTSVLDMTTQKVLPSGDATVETTYHDFKMSMSQGGQPVDQAQFAPLIEMVKKIKTIATVTPRGLQKDIRFDGLPTELNQLQEALSNSRIGATPEFPDKALKVGDAWTQQDTMNLQQGPIQLKIDLKLTYTFMGYSQMDKARVAVFKTSLDMIINNTTSEMMGTRMSLGGTGKGDGYLYFDGEAGRVLKSDLEMVQTIKLKVDLPPNAPAGPANNVEMVMTTSSGLSHVSSKMR